MRKNCKHVLLTFLIFFLLFIDIRVAKIKSFKQWNLEKLKKEEFVSGEVLVKFKKNINEKSIEGISFKKIGTKFNIYHIKLKGGVSVEEAIEKYKNDPNVEYAEPNFIRHLCLVPNDTRFTEQWGLDNTGQTVNGVAGKSDADIDAVEAWGIGTGNNDIVIAVIDTGVSGDHPDLTDNMWVNSDEIHGDWVDNDRNGYIDDYSGWDFVDGDNSPFDYEGHGTHVAGIIAAAGNNSKGISGVNWTARIMPIKIFSPDGATSSDIIKAVNYAIDNDADVINAGFGGDEFSQAERDAISASNSAGLLFIAAAGNDSVDNDTYPSYPASYDVPNIIAVAASGQDDALAYFSNYGSVSVDVASPGENIYSAVPARKCVWLDDFDDGNMSGWTTSGINNKWGLTTKSSVSGNYSLADSPSGNYADNTDSYAVTPCINLSGEKGAALKFKMKWSLETDEDAIFVGINEAGVDTTAWLGYLTGGSDDYYELDAGISKWDGKSISVVFRMYSGKSSTYDGVYIDDVEITAYSSSYSGTEYDYKDGTSMAAPYVSGLAGLIRSVSPSLTNLQIKRLILEKVDILPGLQKKVLTGGRINAYSAVSTSVVPKRLLSMTVTQADTTDVLFGTNNNPVLILDIVVDGCLGSLNLNSIQVDSQRTLDGDIAVNGARIWRSQSSVFDTAAAIQIGSGKNSNDSIWHDINYDLPAGHTYIFVTYDVSSQSIFGNFIDASIPANGVNIGGFTYSAGTWDPAGSRKISSVRTMTIGEIGSYYSFLSPIFNSSFENDKRYSRSASLYKPEEIKTAGVIKKICYKKQDTTGLNSGANELSIYLKETTDSSLSNLEWDALFSGSKQVYTSNSQTFPSDTGWVDFNFGTTTFNYNGTQNLLILVSWHRLGTLSGSTMKWCYDDIHSYDDNSRYGSSAYAPVHLHSPLGFRPYLQFEIDMPFVDGVAPVPNIISLGPSTARIEITSCLAYDNTPPIYYQIEGQFFDGSNWTTAGGVSNYDFSTTCAVPWIDDGLLTNGLYRYRQILKDSASPVHYDTGNWSEMAALVDSPTDSDIFITNVGRNGLKVGVNSFLPVPSGYGATGIYFDMVKGGDQDSGWVADMSVNYINLLPNTQYGWKVKYRNYKGVETGYNSTEKKVYTLALPPSDLSPVDVRKDSVLLEWIGSGAGRFQMERAADSAGIYTVLDGGITSTSYRDTCLTVDNTYWYRVSGFNGDGVITEAAKILRVDVVNNQVPSVSLSGAPDNGHGPLLVNFTANAQDNDGYIVNYKWDFEADGVYDTTTASNIISHTYNGPGVYTITVMVKDNNGAAPVSTITVTVLPPNNPPVVGLLTASVESGYVPLYVEFSASGYDNDGNIVKYEWDVDGDGIYDLSGSKANYTYTNAGMYNVCTKVVDDDGAEAKLSKTINVTKIPDSSLQGNLDTVSSGSENCVDGHDLYIMGKAFGSAPSDLNWKPLANTNGDLIIDGDDLVILAANFGK